MNQPTASKTFEAELYWHGSWGARDAGKYTSTMDYYDIEGDAGRGYIEWDIPDMDHTEEIGLQFEMRKHINNPKETVRALVDYDGIMALPREAVELLESIGIIVDDEFKDWLPEGDQVEA